MNKHYISGIVFSCLLMVLAPHSTQAYFTTGQTAVAVTNTAAIFSIEYAFGLKEHDMYMPVLAVRDLPWESDEKKVGYSLLEDEQATTTGNAVGIVLSSAPIVDGMYKIEKGAAQKMTLLVVFTTPTASPEGDYSLLVNRLPYYVDTDEAAYKVRQMNPSELQYYVTKEIELNTK